MSDCFIGEIQLFGFNYNPSGWAYCNGATMPLQQNVALYSLLGTSYGGDGQNTFKLPDFSGRAGCQQGQGPGLTPRPLGATFGSNSVTLDSNQMPQHNHVINAFSQPDASKKGHSPGSGSAFSSLGSATAKPFVTAPLNTQFATNMIQASAGGGQPHPNQQPYLALNFCIALQGEFPSFS